jgi:hypothetical protein
VYDPEVSSSINAKSPDTDELPLVTALTLSMSPALTDTSFTKSDADVSVSDIVVVKSVSAPFFLSVTVMLSPAPGAGDAFIRKFLTVPATGHT